jgi:hypothetical protein
MHAVLRQPLRERLADAVGAAGDDRDLVLMSFGQVSRAANSASW